VIPCQYLVLFEMISTRSWIVLPDIFLIWEQNLLLRM